MGTHVKPSFSGVYKTYNISRDGNLHFSMGKLGVQGKVFFPKPNMDTKNRKERSFPNVFLGSIFIPLCPFYSPFEFIVDVFLGVISTKRLHSFGLMES